MRVIGGKFKGYNLFLTKNKITRPLKDSVKEAIFNVIVHSKKFDLKFSNTDVLDLYSGTGSIGIECISRGARSVCFVEKNFNAINILKKNILKLNLKSNVKIFNEKIETYLEKKKDNSKFQLIFLDPPFIKKDIKELIDLLISGKKVSKNNLIILHRNKNENEKLVNNIEIFNEKTYGKSKIIFFRLII